MCNTCNQSKAQDVNTDLYEMFSLKRSRKERFLFGCCVHHFNSSLWARQEPKSKNRLTRWGVDSQVHVLNWCPSIRVTVLLVFILLHCSRSSGRYLAAPYHAKEFTQNHTDMTQPQLLTALNWTIRTVCSIIIFVLIIINMLVVVAVPLFSITGDCSQYFVHYVLRCPTVSAVSSAVFKCDGYMCCCNSSWQRFF